MPNRSENFLFTLEDRFLVALEGFLAAANKLRIQYYKETFPSIKPDEIKAEIGLRYTTIYNFGTDDSDFCYIRNDTGAIRREKTKVDYANIYDKDFGVQCIDAFGVIYDYKKKKTKKKKKKRKRQPKPPLIPIYRSKHESKTPKKIIYSKPKHKKIPYRSKHETIKS